MIWTVENSQGMKLVDNRGVAIPHAFEFNDKTCEVKFYLMGKREGKDAVIMSGRSYYAPGYEIVKASAIVVGAKMVSKETKTPFKEPE